MNREFDADQLQIVRAETDESRRDSFPEHVRKGLSADQKWLSPRFFYDRRGSELFERITRLPEYYPYRAEREILEEHAGALTSGLGDGGTIVELGSGNSEKSRILLRDALEEADRLHYVPVDVSEEFLVESARAIVDDFERLDVTPVVGTYGSGLRHLPERDGRRLFVFLGGSIGNFEPAEATRILGHVRRAMHPDDRFLMGFDRLKDPEVIEAAYNDEQDVTAEFNKNILRRINRELDGRFDPDRFHHEAPFVEQHQRIEMHLVSREDQTVPVEALDRSFSFEEGESIHTENSYKFKIDDMVDLCREAGLDKRTLLLDERAYFCVLQLDPI